DLHTATASAVFIGFALISNLDVLLAKIFLAAHAAGEYAALAAVEKIILFLPAAVSVVMVPRAAATHHAAGTSRRVLRIASLFVGVTTLLVGLPAALAPHRVLQLMFGAKYVGAAGGVLPIVLAGAGLAIVYLLVVYTVAIQDRRPLWLLGGGIALQV